MKSRAIVTLMLVSICQIFLTACASLDSGGAGQVETNTINQRPADDVARDADRKPFAVLEFLGVQPGMTVLDVISSSGYYAEALSTAVGAEGRVYAQNPAVALRFFSGANDRAMNKRLFGNRLPNVRRLDREFGDLGLIKGSIDVAITALNFHDVYNNSPAAAQAILLDIKAALKPGGVLGIIDHVGEEGADNKKLHRIYPGLVVAAAEQAGFIVERSDLLANPNDDYSQGPFTEGLRGKTDRFVLKLIKPSTS